MNHDTEDAGLDFGAESKQERDAMAKGALLMVIITVGILVVTTLLHFIPILFEALKL